MATKKFPSELSNRGTVKTTDKILIHNIDTGETCYSTVTELFALITTALALKAPLASPTFTGVVLSPGRGIYSFGSAWNIAGSSYRGFSFTAINDKMYTVKVKYTYCKDGDATKASYCEWNISFYDNAGSLAGKVDTKVVSQGTFATNITLVTTMTTHVPVFTIYNSDATATILGCLVVEIISTDRPATLSY